MDGLRLDVLHAMRSLRRNGGYAGVVILMLGLGIGANTAMFGVIRAVLLAPLPLDNGDRLVRLYQPNTSSRLTGLSPLEMRDYEESPAVETIVEYHSMPFTFIAAAGAQRLQTGVVSAGYFDALGVSPLVGRTFRAGEDTPGSDPVLLLSWEYWQREFGGDPDVVGTTLRMNDRTHTVVGVLPRLPAYPDANDVWMPSSSCPFRSAADWAESRTARQAAFALLRAGTGVDAAVSELGTIAARLHATYPEAYPAERNFTVAAVPIARLMTDAARPTLLMLLGATAFLLLIISANVINLAVVRLIRRDQELATQLAMGAGPRRILRQVTTETLILALAGGVLGIVVARVGIGAALPFAAGLTPRMYEVRVGAEALAFAAAVAAVVGLAGGLLPTLMRLRQLHEVPGRTTRGTGSAHSRLRGALIIVQVTVSIVLLAGAGLMIRSLVRLHDVDPGFEAERVLTAVVALNWTRYDDAGSASTFYRAVEQRLADTPGVEHAAFAASFPLNGYPSAQISVVTDRQESGTEAARVAVNSVSSGYFATLGVPVLRGRALEDADGVPGTPVAVLLTETSARRLFGDIDVVGRRISADGGQEWGSVVGVVGDMRQQIDGEFEAAIFVHLFRSHSVQSRLLVRGTAGRKALEDIMRSAVADVDAEQPVADVRSIEQFRDATLLPRRVVAILLSTFAALALLIAAGGIAGVIAFAVAQREREIGIRRALGAGPAGLVGMVMRHALMLAAAGVMLGTAAAFFATRLLETFLFGVPPTDPATFVGVAATLLGAAALAGAVPALRALRVEPVTALRGP